MDSFEHQEETQTLSWLREDGFGTLTSSSFYLDQSCGFQNCGNQMKTFDYSAVYIWYFYLILSKIRNTLYVQFFKGKMYMYWNIEKSMSIDYDLKLFRCFKCSW